MGDAKFKAYILNGKEYYVYEFDPTDPSTTAIRDGNLFPESLVSFAYLDRKSYEPVLRELHSALSKLYECQTQDAADTVWACLDRFFHIHVYFEFLRVDWQTRLMCSAQNGFRDVQELLPCEELSSLTDEIESRQQQIKSLFVSELDMDAPPKKRPAMISLSDLSNPITDFPFSTLNFGFERTENGTYVEVLYPRSMYDLIDYHLRNCLMQRARMRVCKNCGKYFAVIKNSKAEYCNHPFDEKGRSCREVASIIQWNQNHADDVIFRQYRREYKKRFARMKAGTMEEAHFYLWSKQAREKKAECERGVITLKEFLEWLNQS